MQGCERAWLSSIKKVVSTDTVKLGDRTLKINVTRRHGCFLEILESIKDQLDAMLSHHARILVIRIELHVTAYHDKNELLSKFIRKLRKKLKAKYKVNRMGFAWVREIEKAKQQHYHMALMLDAHKIKHPSSINNLVETIWTGWGQPKPYIPKNCYYLLQRNDADEYAKAFYRLSYLAKQRGKGYRANTANDYSTSRIKNAHF